MDTSLEKRLTALEAAVTELKQQNIQPEPNWIEQITGSFKDDPIWLSPTQGDKICLFE